ncbi:histo-blood group ABO system transferase 1-like isoform X5 [Colius striatus]|uniref:histo-blood group ABO system transferase 1-like isoform X5 n=1 Tax=Colius striatus TaxID=57412 RepID=UPI002B1D4750|nr:histo-blood group ABO system transferase 1-like isoform X5 [Colius striatus]XP_061876101.1 histo-blood group ABO system transferase 1-like isoform X5 [Colius striatus]
MMLFSWLCHKSEQLTACLDGQQWMHVLLYPEPLLTKPRRRDVLVLTPWLAPIVWEGTFNRGILNAQYMQKNLVTGVVTFAVEKYVQFIKGFMSSANKYFLAGHQVNFYLFTDNPEQISHLQLAPENHLFVIPVQNHTRWQDISLRRMGIISTYIQSRFQYEVDYLYSIDIDVQLVEHVGVEIIDTLVGTISSWHYDTRRESKPYEPRAESRAAVPQGEGDFYYTASFYGGSVAEVYRLTRACFKVILEDRGNGIEARWHDESHLNKYLLEHKPTRLLSPEYCWDAELSRPRIIQVLVVHQDEGFWLCVMCMHWAHIIWTVFD